MKKTIVITGGAGYIGSKLIDKLISGGMRVVVIDNLSYGSQKNINDKAVFYKLDIMSPEIFDILKTEKPDVIIHLAASKDVASSLKNPVEFTRINILGSVNVINCAYQLGIKKIIFTSTAGVYGNNLNGEKQKESQATNSSSPYAWTKLAIEEYITYMNKNCGMNGIILRFANVYGLGGISQYKSVVNIFVDKLINNQNIIIHGDGKQTRDFIYIDDLIDLCKLLIDSDPIIINESPIFNVSTGIEVSIMQLLETILRSVKTNPQIVFENTIFSGQKRSILDTEKTKKVLGWHSKTSLEDGIKKIIEHYQYKGEKNEK
jgi:UDP-glucose 4-epimerase